MARMFANSLDALLVRRAILLQLDAASPASIPPETILLGLRISGFEIDSRELSMVLDYLAQKNYIAITCSQISASHRRAKLSAAGRDYLESGDF